MGLAELIGGADGVNLSLVLSEVMALVPKVLPAVIGFLAFRKGYAFIRRCLRGA